MSSQKITGGCLCGAVSYETQDEPTVSGHCHCTDCKKSSGAGHINATFVPKSGFKVTGQTTAYTSQADSGNTIERHFCPTCGSRLFAYPANGMVGIMAGTMNNLENFQPMFEVFTKRRCPWDNIKGDLPSFDEMPPKE